jgi:hypothetical protein
MNGITHDRKRGSACAPAPRADPVRPSLYRGITKRTRPPEDHPRASRHRHAAGPTSTARQRLSRTSARDAIVLAHRAVRHPGPLGPAVEAPSSGSAAAALVAAGVVIAWGLLGAPRRPAVTTRA